MSQGDLRFRAMADAAPVLIWETDENGVIFLNRHYLEFFGADFDTVRAMGWAKFMHPDDAEGYEGAYREAFRHRKPYTYECRFRRADGTYRWLRNSGRPVDENRFVGCSVDVTDLQETQLALRVSEAHLQQILDTAATGLTRCSRDLRYLGANRAYAEIAGLPVDQIVGRPIEEVMGREGLETIRPYIERVLRGETVEYESEVPFRAGGRCLHVVYTPWREPDGTVSGWVASVTDVSDRKRAEMALRQSEQRYALAMEAAGDGHTDWNLVTGEFYVSPRLLEMLGYAPGTTFADRADWVRRLPLHPEDRPKWEAAIAAHFAGREAKFRMDLRVVVHGETRWVAFTFIATRDASGKPVRWTGSIADITDQKRAEGLLAGEKHLLEMMARATPLSAVLDALCRIIEENLSGCLCAVTLIDATGARLEHVAAPSLPREYVQAVHGRAGDHDAGPCGMAALSSEQVICPDVATDTRWVEQGWCALALSHGLRSCWSTPIMSSAKNALGTFAIYFRQPSSPTGSHDSFIERFTNLAAVAIERSRAEEALRESEQRYERVMLAAQAGFWDWDVAADKFYVSPKLLEMTGFPPGTEIAGRADFMARAPFYPDDRITWERAVEQLFASGGTRLTGELRTLHGAETRWFVLSGMCVRDPDGKVQRWTGSATYITEEKRAKEALRLSEERYALAMETSEEGHFDWNVQTDEIFASERLKQVLDLPADAEHRTRSDVVAHIPFYPGDRERLEQMNRDMLAGSALHTDLEFRLLRGQAQELRWIRARWRIFRNEDGAAQRIIGVVSDVTEMRKMEQELRRAQRLEAMGTLAGGIAHDFNNILGAIVGYGEMALRDAKKGTRLRRDVDSIMAAGERGRALVDRILAFSRSGVGERVPVNVEAVVREALDQIGANLPENVTVAPRLYAGRAAMLGDSTQVHQVVMNLASNAVQAMPQGGALSVALETAAFDTAQQTLVGAIVPGEYVVLRVSDTGTGIPNDVFEHMFDPFFTTKEVGVGNGLGLSLVHGIVTNAGGAIDVATEIGKGTTFSVYLRRTGIAPEAQADESRPLPRGEGQRVLVVDDEEPLVRLATETLERLGYAPVGFTSSTAALAAFRADPQRFDALLTDERMPGLSGSTLIREVRGIRDAIPIVLMSGYLRVDNADADVVVKKPLLARDLAASMARALHH